MQCWARTNIDVTSSLKIDLKDYLLSDPYRPSEHALYMPDVGGIWTLTPDVLFSKEWIDYIRNDLGLELDIAQIFFRQPYYQHPGAHVDVAKDLTIYGAALNWTLDIDDADMVWYNYPDQDPNFTQRSASDVNYEWPLGQLTELDRCTVGQQPTLVRTDVPHSVDMRSNERWAVSVRLADHSSWQDYRTSLQERLIDETLV